MIKVPTFVMQLIRPTHDFCEFVVNKCCPHTAADGWGRPIPTHQCSILNLKASHCGPILISSHRQANYVLLTGFNF